MPFSATRGVVATAFVAVAGSLVLGACQPDNVPAPAPSHASGPPWAHASAPPSGAPTAVASVAPTTQPTTLPAPTSAPTGGEYSQDYEGTWKGKITDTANGKYVNIELNLYPLIGKGIVTYAFSDGSCWGNTVLTQNGAKVHMSEAMTDTSKCGNGFETFWLTGAQLHFERRKNPSDVNPGYTGILTKSS